MDFSGKTILVTGGTRGIGAHITKHLIDEGATVIANFVRDQKSAEVLLEGVSDAKRLHLCKADLTREKGMQQLVDQVRQLAPVHGLVHCAVTGIHKPLESLTLRHWDWTHAVNIRAFFNLIQKLRKSFSNPSSIVALSSVGAERASAHYALVGATKGGLEALCRHLAYELQPDGIRVNVVSPGSIVTSAWDAFPDKETRIARLEAKFGKVGLLNLDDIAHTVLFLLSARSAGINAHTLVVDKGERIFE